VWRLFFIFLPLAIPILVFTPASLYTYAHANAHAHATAKVSKYKASGVSLLHAHTHSAVIISQEKRIFAAGKHGAGVCVCVCVCVCVLCVCVSVCVDILTSASAALAAAFFRLRRIFSFSRSVLPWKHEKRKKEGEQGESHVRGRKALCARSRVGVCLSEHTSSSHPSQAPVLSSLTCALISPLTSTSSLT
jgi:hypothetical protein